VTTWATGEVYSYTYPGSNTTTSRQDVFQISFFADTGSNIWCDVQMMGIAEQQSSAVTGQLLPPQTGNPNGTPPYTGGTPPKTYTGVISGIIDAPFPMPASNVASNNLPANYSLGSVVYGNTQTYGTQRSNDWSVGGGFSTSYETTAGVGPSFSLSVQAAAILNSGSSQYSTFLNSQSVETEVGANGTVVNNGFAFGSNVVYGGTGWRILDPTGSVQLPGSAIVCNLSATIASAYFPFPFTPYLVTAGDIASYTIEQINANAKTLGIAPTSGPYIGDYVNGVIRANALPMANNANCLTWSQADNGQVVPGYLYATDDWTETGWSLDISSYIGISAATQTSANVSVGVGGSETVAGFQFQAMVGVNVSGSHTQTDDQSQQIQITFQNLQIPLAVNPSDVTEMSVEVYFLPANALWMKELAANSGLAVSYQADTNSLPWRIFFLVTYYQLKDGTIYPSS
jgi:hypothetical protein